MLLTRLEREKLRLAFRPSSVRLLFVGESPPASGRFFYTQNSGLYFAMREAFRQIAPAIDDGNFLVKFKASGCYLIDLCRDPVDHLDPNARHRARKTSEASLTRRIAEIHPPAMALLLRSIASNVARAAARAGWQGQVIHLPYPGRWHQHRAVFIQTLAPSLSRLLSNT
jgi:hypothetical protein